MKLLNIATAFLLLVFAAAPAAAHGMKELGEEMSKREKYFQPLDKETPSFALKDAKGQPVRLSDFRGKAVVLHFIYASCPDACPLHADLLGRVQSMVNETPMQDQVQFVTITTDPVNDTPEILEAYGPPHGLDSSNWVFLTSGPENPEETRELVERFGHRFDVIDGGAQIHAVVTHVIDKEGRWRANFHGLKFEPTSLVVYLNGLVNEHGTDGHPEPTLWQRLLSWF